VFLHIYGDMMEKSRVDFVRWLKLASPIKIIIKLLTDNGSRSPTASQKRQEAQRPARLRQGLYRQGHRASLGAVSAPANEWHGRTSATGALGSSQSTMSKRRTAALGRDSRRGGIDAGDERREVQMFD
jgi:hypothetical protein